MVSNGLNKAPVRLIARLLDVLRVSQQQTGGQFLNHYANVSAVAECWLPACLYVCEPKWF
jgi:hypothetical protein